MMDKYRDFSAYTAFLHKTTKQSMNKKIKDEAYI